MMRHGLPFIRKKENDIGRACRRSMRFSEKAKPFPPWVRRKGLCMGPTQQARIWIPISPSRLAKSAAGSVSVITVSIVRSRE